MFLEKELPFVKLIVYCFKNFYIVRFIFLDTDYRLLFTYQDFNNFEEIVNIEMGSNEISITVLKKETVFKIIEFVLQECKIFEKKKKEILKDLDQTLTKIIDKIFGGEIKDVNRKDTINNINRDLSSKKQSCIQDGARMYTIFSLRKDNLEQKTGNQPRVSFAFQNREDMGTPDDN